MKILAGKYKSRALAVPPQRETRPTLTRVRQVLFDILSHANLLAGWENLRVADVYAGTGSLGLEAMSRGAVHCTFFECDSLACQAIEGNISHLQLEKRSRVLGDAEAPPKVNEAVGLAIFDPPYQEYKQLDGVMGKFLQAGWLNAETLLVVQTARKSALLHNVQHLRSKEIGITRLSFYRGFAAGSAEATRSDRDRKG